MSPTPSRRKWLLLALAALLAAGGAVLWSLRGAALPERLTDTARAFLAGNDLPEGFASGNGRIEATEVDVATKLAGRLTDVLANEGDRVEAGQVVARLDTDSLAAQLRQMQAQLRRAQQDRQHALAVVEQRKSEQEFARRDLQRVQRLAQRDQFASEEQLDRARTGMETAAAALRATEVQVLAAEAAIEAAQAGIDRIRVEIADSTLTAPRTGRVLYRLAEPGEVLGVGGKVLTLLDISDVYMVIFLPETVVGRVALGAEARLVLDAAPGYVIPARVSFVAVRAQFTPKQVETKSAREKLSFRVKIRIDTDLLARYEPLVKTGVPGVAYVRLDPPHDWPANLAPKLPEWQSAKPVPSSD
jgi:HlyD family secretion protein